MPLLAKKILLACLSLIVSLLFFELAFRLLDYRGFHAERVVEIGNSRLEKHERIEGVNLQYRPDSSFRFIYDSNPRGYFDADGSLTIELNRWGLRGPDFEVPKPDGTTRVMLLGDSFTFGAGVRDEHTFAHRLGELLGEQVGPHVEVINCGVSAWSTDIELLFLEAEGMKYQPDLVVVVFVPNDANYAAQLDLWEKFRNTYEPPAMLQNSYVLSFVYSRIAREIVGRRYVDNLTRAAIEFPSAQKKWRNALDALARIEEVAGAGGARFAIVMFPFMYELDRYPLTAIHDKVRKQAEALDVPYLDLLASFAGHDYVDLWVHASDQHPNEIGHEIAAEAMADFLVREGLVESGE